MKKNKTSEEKLEEIFMQYIIAGSFITFLLGLIMGFCIAWAIFD